MFFFVLSKTTTNSNHLNIPGPKHDPLKEGVTCISINFSNRINIFDFYIFQNDHNDLVELLQKVSIYQIHSSSNSRQSEHFVTGRVEVLTEQ